MGANELVYAKAQGTWRNPRRTASTSVWNGCAYAAASVGDAESFTPPKWSQNTAQADRQPLIIADERTVISVSILAVLPSLPAEYYLSVLTAAGLPGEKAVEVHRGQAASRVPMSTPNAPSVGGCNDLRRGIAVEAY